MEILGGNAGGVGVVGLFLGWHVEGFLSLYVKKLGRAGIKVLIGVEIGTTEIAGYGCEGVSGSGLVAVVVEFNHSVEDCMGIQ
jgi:hypothetical protein